MTNSLSLRRVKFCNLVPSYEAYFKALRESERNWTQIQLELPQSLPKLTLWTVGAFHVTRILLARLHAVARTGSFLALIQSRWDPIILAVLLDHKLLGYCFVGRQSAGVFQISLIADVGQEQDEWAKRYLWVAVKKHLKILGATRIFVRTSTKELKDVLKMTGFNSAIQDNILYLDL